MPEFMTALSHQKANHAQEVELMFEREILVSELAKIKKQEKHSMGHLFTSHKGVGTASDTNVVDISSIVEAFSKTLKMNPEHAFTAEEKEAWGSLGLARHGRLTISLAEFTAATNAAENTPKTH